MDPVVAFEDARPRLNRLASRILNDRHEAQDVVQAAWLRLTTSPSEVLDIPAWLTTVTTRLCLDRLKARTPRPVDTSDGTHEVGGVDPSLTVEHAENVGQALHVVTDSLTPNERVVFVLAESFGYDFTTIGQILGRTAGSARQLASRARRKVAGHDPAGAVADWEVVDAFLAAARGGDLERLLTLLAPHAEVSADAAALLAGTPARITGRQNVAEFFDGSARAALPVFTDGRPGAAWMHQGQARVVFDFTVSDERVAAITFRADPEVLAAVASRRDGGRKAMPTNTTSHS